ncbi:MAG: redoxin domain-containing protein [Candidatus Brocadiaceae bacterium]|nr:redoxin domain-containing protein [Candidatus Brocadiaceae bacterium]
MKKENFLIITVVITFFSFWLTFDNDAMGMRQDADARLQLDTILKDLSTYSMMKPEDAKGYYEDALSELNVLVEMFSGTEETLEAMFCIGNVHNQMGNYAEAINSFDNVLSHEEAANDTLFKAKLLFFKAKALLGYGSISEAKEVIMELRLIDPRAANAFGKELGGTMRIGMLAPDFHTKDYKGNKISLSEYEGKIIVMHFWATWNDRCLKEFPEIKKLYRKLKGPDVQFLGISRDDQIDDLTGFVLQQNIDWPQIFEGMRHKGMMSKLYDVHKIPITFVLDQSGRVQYIGNSNEKITQVVTTLIVRGEKKSDY